MTRLASIVLLLHACRALAALPDAALPSAGQSRYRFLCRRLIAPCCWSQTVDVHVSPAADQVRREVAALIIRGSSDREILDSFIARYGERILSEPEGGKALVLTTVPVVAGLSGAACLGWFLRQARRKALAVSEGPALPLPQLESFLED